VGAGAGVAPASAPANARLQHVTRPPADDRPDFDVSDQELRASGSVKWTWAGPGVLPAWVAEMDVRACPAVARAVHDAVDRGAFGYPGADRDTELPQACAEFAGHRLGLRVPPERVVLCGDVMAGIRLALDTLCDPGPVVVPVPSYPPFLSVVPLTGRKLVTLDCTGPPERPGLDLDAIGRALADGARTVLLSQPHNPLGRAFTPAELTGLRDLADRHGARVISDEIHAPLVLPGARHTPYAGIEGTEAQVTTLVAASKAWNIPGLKCAQIIAGSDADLAALRAAPPVANHGTSSLGVIASIAAYRHGGPWLDGVLGHLAAQRELFTRLLAEHLPDLRWTPMEATYLAWLDARGTGLADPAAAALARGRVMVNPGRHFGPGYEGFVRVNLATSAERLERVVRALAGAWEPGAGRG
jgi:cysteine-S-conjugate beta-lyase